MNLDTVLMCAQLAARQQLSALGYVDPDTQDLIAEVQSLLAPDPVVETPKAKTKAKVAAKD
jgi:hypothetical protein